MYFLSILVSFHVFLWLLNCSIRSLERNTELPARPPDPRCKHQRSPDHAEHAGEYLGRRVTQRTVDEDARNGVGGQAPDGRDEEDYAGLVAKLGERPPRQRRSLAARRCQRTGRRSRLSAAGTRPRGTGRRAVTAWWGAAARGCGQ